MTSNKAVAVQKAKAINHAKLVKAREEEVKQKLETGLRESVIESDRIIQERAKKAELDTN